MLKILHLTLMEVLMKVQWIRMLVSSSNPRKEKKINIKNVIIIEKSTTTES